MKKLLSIIILATVSFNFVACQGKVNNNILESEFIKNENKIDLDTELSGEITVSAYDTMVYEQYLNEAKEKFESLNPNTKINLEFFSKIPETKTTTLEDGTTVMMMASGDDGAGKKDYINRINTELMSGKGPDIIAGDVIPYYKYAQSGQIEDLNNYIDADKTFNKNDYYLNVLEGGKFGDKQVIFPLDFNFSYVNYSNKLLTQEQISKLNAEKSYSYDKLVEIGKENFKSDENIMFDFGGGKLKSNVAFSYLYENSYDKFLNFVDKKANFSDGEFAKILEKSKDYEENGYIKKSNNINEKDIDPEKLMLDFKAMQGKSYFTYANSLELMFKYMEINDNMELIGALGAGDSYSIGELIENDVDKFNFNYSLGYAINSNTANKKLAWEFLKFLAGEKMQSSMTLGNGNAINKNSHFEKSKLMFSKESFGKSELDTASVILNEEEAKNHKNYIDKLNTFTDKLNNLNIKDEAIDTIVFEEVEKFYSGDKTADEVSNIIQDKVSLYLNE